MSVDTQALYERMVDDCGVSQDSERFKRKFLRAVNDVSRDLELRAFYEIDAITDLETAIDADELLTRVYQTGVWKYLADSKEFALEPSDRIDQYYARELARAQTLYLTDNPPETRETGYDTTSSDSETL